MAVAHLSPLIVYTVYFGFVNDRLCLSGRNNTIINHDGMSLTIGEPDFMCGIQLFRKWRVFRCSVDFFAVDSQGFEMNV